MVRSVLLLACLLLSACSSTMFDPRYRVSTLVFDEGLLGVWTSTDDGTRSIAFFEKRLPLDADGRLDTSWPDLWLDQPHWDADAVGPPPPPRPLVPRGPSARIYDVVIGSAGSEEQILLNGYLSRIGGERYLGVQLSYLGLMFSYAPVPFLLPTHTLWKIERRHGRWTVSYPMRGPVVLAMLGGELDAQASEENLPEGSSARPVFTSIDRLQAYYRKHAGDPHFFLRADHFERGADQIEPPGGWPGNFRPALE